MVLEPGMILKPGVVLEPGMVIEPGMVLEVGAEGLLQGGAPPGEDGTLPDRVPTPREGALYWTPSEAQGQLNMTATTVRGAPQQERRYCEQCPNPPSFASKHGLKRVIPIFRCASQSLNLRHSIGGVSTPHPHFR